MIIMVLGSWGHLGPGQGCGGELFNGKGEELVIGLSNVVATRHLSCLLLQTKPYVQQGRFNTLGNDRPSIKTRLRGKTAVTRVDTVASIDCHPMISVFLKMKPLRGSEST